MLRHFTVFFAILALTHATCTVGPHADAQGKAKASDPANYHEACISAIRTQVRFHSQLHSKISFDCWIQVRKEFEASLQYLLMGAYFGQDNIDLQGFADMFFEHADEERQHGIM
jgi:hypothetical protein